MARTGLAPGRQKKIGRRSGLQRSCQVIGRRSGLPQEVEGRVCVPSHCCHSSPSSAFHSIGISGV